MLNVSTIIHLIFCEEYYCKSTQVWLSQGDFSFSALSSCVLSCFAFIETLSSEINLQ